MIAPCSYSKRCPAYLEGDLKCDKRYIDCQLYKFREDLKERGLIHLIETKENDMLPEDMD